jgi:hypothetical protein
MASVRLVAVKPDKVAKIDLSKSEPELRTFSRRRVLTEKGLAYEIDKKSTKYRDALKRLKTKTDNIRSKFVEVVPRIERDLMYSHWLTLYEQFMDCYDEYVALLPEENEDGDLLGPNDEDLKEFRQNAQEWIKAGSSTGPVTLKRDPDERSRVSRLSRRSSRSGTFSLKTSISASKFQEEQRRAELEVKAAKLEAKFKLEQELEKLQLEEELAISRARSRVIDCYEKKCSPDKPIVTLADMHESEGQRMIVSERDVVQHEVRVGLPQVSSTMRSELKHDAQEYSPVYSKPAAPSDQYTHANAMENVSESYKTENAIASVVRHLRKPVTELSKFSGDPLEYKRFMRQFKTKILCNTDDDDERLNYLEQYTAGEAQKIVSGLSYLDASVAYTAVLRELDERYGDPDVIVHEFIKRALNWPFIKGNNPKALDEYSIFLVECLNAVQSLEALKVLDYSENMRQLVAKLPLNLHDKWRNLVCQTKEKGGTVMFYQLVNFVKREAKKANDPTYGKLAIDYEHKDERRGVKVIAKRVAGTFATNAMESRWQNSGNNSKPNAKSETKSQSQIVSIASMSNRGQQTADNSFKEKVAIRKPCFYCENRNHSLDSCTNIVKLSHNDRIEFLKKKGFCFGCLKFGHQKNGCRNKSTCDACHGRHPTILHFGNPFETTDRQSAGRLVDRAVPGGALLTGQLTSHMGAGEGECTLAVVPVKLRKKNGMKEITTYAFLDPGSNVSFCTEALMKELSTDRKRVRISMNTMGIPYKMNTYHVTDLEISDLKNKNVVSLPGVYTKDAIPIDRSYIPTMVDVAKWPHMNGVILPEVDAEIGLLLGNNVPDAYVPLEVRTGPRGSPHASRTLLGWIPWNVIRDGSRGNYSVNEVQVKAIQLHHDDKQLEQLYRMSISRDFPEHDSEEKKELSQEDKLFLSKLDKSVHQVDGHYEICLPFRKEEVSLPDNRIQAEQRLKSVQHRMRKDHKFHKDYANFMESIIEKGFAEMVPDKELDRQDGRTWYLPHHGVYHPKKPNKIRVVYDCAASYHGVSLNRLLLQGPDLTGNLVQVLLKFRQEKIAVVGDVDAMFHQVRVAQTDSDCLRYLWWPEGDYDKEPRTYRMLVHLFGATSSPSCANYALRKTAQDYGHEFPPVVSRCVAQNLYVDDLLMSLPSEDEAISFVANISALCQKGGFTLSKWISNSRAVLANVP